MLSKWLVATGLVYAAGALDFTVRPNGALQSLNMTGGIPLESEPAGLYNALASAYMATIAALALGASSSPAGSRLIPPLLVAKATSSGGFLYRFVRTGRRGYAVAAAIDAVLLGVTGGLYAATNERARSRAR